MCGMSKRSPTLKNLRIAAGLTQEHLAALAGCSTSTYARAERKNAWPSARITARLLEALSHAVNA